MSAKTWIDLTDMVGWSGQHGGTQRVVYGIAEQYYQNMNNQNARLGFFVFDSKNRKFVEADFSPIRARAQTEAKHVNSAHIVNSKKAKIKSIALAYLPVRITSNEALKKYSIFAARKVLNSVRYLRKTKNRIIRLESSPASTRKEVIFEQDDIVLLLGKPWDYPEMTKEISKLKNKINFTLGAIVYDLVIPLHPHLHATQLFKDYTRYMFEICQAADILFPISKSSESDLFKFCDSLTISRPKTRVVRLGDRLENVTGAIKPKTTLPKQFILCVGTIEVRKNHTLLYYAYKLAAEKGIDLPHLIIVGRLGWHASDIYGLLNNDALIKNKITILTDVSDSELAWLYKNCLFTVYPSIYEGWGLPVAESIQYGKLAVASRSSSIPEIAGDLLEYFSPFSSDQCMEMINKYSNNDIRESKQKTLVKGYKSTDWSDTYREIKNTL